MWMTRNYDALIEKMGPTYRPYAPWMAHAFCGKGDQDRVAAFFAKAERSPPGTKRNLGQVMERINRCVQLRKTLTAPLSAWLGANVVIEVKATDAAPPTDSTVPSETTPAAPSTPKDAVPAKATPKGGAAAKAPNASDAAKSGK